MSALRDAGRVVGTGALVKVVGRVRPSVAAFTPFSRTPAVAYFAELARVSVMPTPDDGLHRREAPQLDVNVLAIERAVTPFYVDDGTGSAIVLAEASDLTIPFDAVHVDDLAAAAEWATARIGEIVDPRSIPGLRASEARIAPGDAVEVVGPIHAIETATGYRDNVHIALEIRAVNAGDVSVRLVT